MSTIFADPKTLTHDALEEGTAFAPRFDANGLVTAITVEAGSNAVLMLAHMNAEALAQTQATGEAWFWSRSRAELWHKGGTSGHVMRVNEVLVDCDADTLLLRVRPAGPACHTGATTCFYRPLEALA